MWGRFWYEKTHSSSWHHQCHHHHSSIYKWKSVTQNTQWWFWREREGEGEREERERVRSICMCMWDNEWLCQSMHVSVGKKEVGLMRWNLWERGREGQKRERERESAWLVESLCFVFVRFHILGRLWMNELMYVLHTSFQFYIYLISTHTHKNKCIIHRE